MTQHTEPLHIAVKVVLVQFSMAILVAAVLFVAKGAVAGYSLMLGALTGIIPIGIFALIAFNSARQDPNSALVNLYSGLLLKYILTAGLFILVILTIKPLNTVLVLVGLITTQVVSALAPALEQAK